MSRPRAHWEIKGRFRKRVVLANVPSFRFSFQGNLRTYPRSGFCSGEHPNVASFRGNIRQDHPFGKPPFWQSRRAEGKYHPTVHLALREPAEEGTDFRTRVAIGTACYRTEKARIPQKCWGECWEECREKGDCWEDCWEQCREAGFSGKTEKRHCSQQSAQQAFFPALFPALSPALLGGSGFLSPVAGGPDCNTRAPLKEPFSPGS